MIDYIYFIINYISKKHLKIFIYRS